MYGHHWRHSTTIAKMTAAHAAAKYVLKLSYHTAKRSFTAVLVHFPYFIPPKWEKTVAVLRCLWGHKMLLFCCFAPLNRASLLLPIHPG